MSLLQLHGEDIATAFAHAMCLMFKPDASWQEIEPYAEKAAMVMISQGGYACDDWNPEENFQQVIEAAGELAALEIPLDAMVNDLLQVGLFVYFMLRLQEHCPKHATVTSARKLMYALNVKGGKQRSISETTQKALWSKYRHIGHFCGALFYLAFSKRHEAETAIATETAAVLEEDIDGVFRFPTDKETHTRMREFIGTGEQLQDFPRLFMAVAKTVQEKGCNLYFPKAKTTFLEREHIVSVPQGFNLPKIHLHFPELTAQEMAVLLQD